MQEQKSYPPLLFYSLVFVFYFVDLALFSLLEKSFIYSLLCFYILQLSRPISIGRIITACLLLSMHPLISYGRFGLELIYVIPATLLGIKMRLIFYDSLGQYYLLLAGCLLAQIGLLEYGILHLDVGIPYTISVLFANMVILWMISYFRY